MKTEQEIRERLLSWQRLEKQDRELAVLHRQIGEEEAAIDHLRLADIERQCWQQLAWVLGEYDKEAHHD